MNIKKIVCALVLIIIFLNIVPINVISYSPQILYDTHLKDYGWIDTKQNGQISGTTGESRRIEAIKISIRNLQNYKISYQVHVKDYGWLDYVSENQVAGTTGESRRAEAIIINFENNEYTIRYRVHVQNLGWLDWVNNGQVAGTTGQSLRIEAIQIELISKLNVNRIYNGIDVSKYQGSIDWQKVKNDNIDFAMIRCGYRGYTKGQILEDSGFRANVINAYKYGLKVGLYFYSSALNEKEAIQEADFILNKINEYNFKYYITYPIAIDFENDFIEARNANLTVNERNKICKAFCERISQAGFKPMIYSYTYFLNNRMNMNELNKYDVWVANYSSILNYKNEYTMWQYSSNGKVNGIVNDVDMNYCYINY